MQGRGKPGGTPTTRALITGIAGFVARHLAEYLVASTDADVYGIRRECESCAELEAALAPRLKVFEGDLTDSERVLGVVEEVRPDWIFHLAAQASVASAWSDPMDTLVNNIAAQVNLLQAVRRWGGEPSILVVCSNEEYGTVTPDELPIRETAPFRPANPYAVSKVAQDMLGYQYHVSYGMKIVRVRPFNHTGPGQSDRFVASAFARQIAEAELGMRPPVIRVGNLEVERDFTDARDIVRAYYLAVLRGVPGEVYNLGSERAIAIGHLLELLQAKSRVPVRIETDPGLFRPTDTPRVIADCGKFRSLTDWKAEIPLEKTLSDLLDWWREKLIAVSH
ncbi:MAG TPA: GDP-mannose 4,6-dehydratase [Chloroflexota bacterium]